MIFCGRTGNIPKLPEPLVIVFLADHAKPALLLRRPSVSPGLPMHQEEFYVIFYDRVGFIELAQELCAVVCLERRVRNLVPDDRIEIVKTEFAAYDGYIRVERHYEMPSVLPSGQADVPHNTDKPAAGDKDAIDLLPDFR